TWRPNGVSRASRRAEIAADQIVHRHRDWHAGRLPLRRPTCRFRHGADDPGAPGWKSADLHPTRRSLLVLPERRADWRRRAGGAVRVVPGVAIHRPGPL